MEKNNSMKCKGKNCTANNGIGHSAECQRNHDEAYLHTSIDTPGNRNPEARYSGYKGKSLHENATSDELLAWEEGRNARI